MGSRNLSWVLREMLDDVAPKCMVDASFLKQVSKNIKNPTIADAVAARLLYEGVCNGQMTALREVLDRTEGKAPQYVDIKSNEVTTVDIARAVMKDCVESGWPEEDAKRRVEERYPEAVGFV